MQDLIRNGNVLKIERRPYQVLELRYFLELAGFDHDLPGEDALYSQTILGKGFNPIALSDTDIYCITHTIPYLTDFGFKKFHLFNGENAREIRENLDLLMGMSIHAQHWDLVCELLLAGYCLGIPDPFWSPKGWQALEAHREQTGMIANLPLPPDQMKMLHSDWEKNFCIFMISYHPILMCLLAGVIEAETTGDR